MPPNRKKTPHCEFCFKDFPDQSAVNRHVARTLACKKRNEESFALWKTKFQRSDNAQHHANEANDFGLDRAPAFPFDNMDVDDVFGGWEPVLPEGRPRTTVEDVPNEEDTRCADSEVRFVESFPGKAGIPVDKEIRATPLEKLEETYPEDSMPFGPFKTEEEWEFGEWIASNIGKGKADALLNLNIVSLYWMSTKWFTY